MANTRYGLIRGIVDVNIWGVLPGNKGNQVTQNIFQFMAE